MEGKDKWLTRLDELKERLGISSDVVLATSIGISPAMLAHVRAGRRPLPLLARIRLLDRLNYGRSRDILLEAVPSEARALLIEMDNRRHEKRMRKKGPRK